MFSRLNKCKAYYNHRFYEGTRLELFQLISYDAKVMQAIYDAKYDSWHIWLNDKYYMYSRTTIQHIYKFIKKFRIPITSLVDVRDKCVNITPDVSVYYITDRYCDIEISVYSDSEFNRIWR